MWPFSSSKKKNRNGLPEGTTKFSLMSSQQQNLQSKAIQQALSMIQQLGRPTPSGAGGQAGLQQGYGQGGFQQGGQLGAFDQNLGQNAQSLYGQATQNLNLSGLDPNLLQEQAMKQYNEQILPGIANQFAGTGGGMSSAFHQQIGQSGGDLATRLAGLRYQSSLDRVGIQQQQQGQRQNLLAQLMGYGQQGQQLGIQGYQAQQQALPQLFQAGLQPQFQYGVQPPAPSSFQAFAGGLGQGLGAGARTYLTGGF